MTMVLRENWRGGGNICTHPGDFSILSLDGFGKNHVELFLVCTIARVLFMNTAPIQGGCRCAYIAVLPQCFQRTAIAIVKDVAPPN